MGIVFTTSKSQKTLPRAVADGVKAFYCSDEVSRVRSDKYVNGKNSGTLSHP